MWPTGLSWTKAHDEMVTNPDGTAAKMHVHGGPFYFNPNLFKRKVWVPYIRKGAEFILKRLSLQKKYIYLYSGFRPTATWSVGYGDEGIIVRLGQWMKKKGWGNLSLLTVRFKVEHEAF